MYYFAEVKDEKIRRILVRMSANILLNKCFFSPCLNSAIYIHLICINY